MVELNQHYRVAPAFLGSLITEEKKQVGTVVYIHPKSRYAVLEFDGVNGKPREGFHLDKLTEKNRVKRKRGGRRDG